MIQAQAHHSIEIGNIIPDVVNQLADLENLPTRILTQAVRDLNIDLTEIRECEEDFKARRDTGYILRQKFNSERKCRRIFSEAEPFYLNIMIAAERVLRQRREAVEA